MSDMMKCPDCEGWCSIDRTPRAAPHHCPVDHQSEVEKKLKGEVSTHLAQAMSAVKDLALAKKEIERLGQENRILAARIDDLRNEKVIITS